MSSHSLIQLDCEQKETEQKCDTSHSYKTGLFCYIQKEHPLLNSLCRERMVFTIISLRQKFWIMPSSQGPWESCMNSLALSNLPVSSADIVVGLVGSKVQELPESPFLATEKSNFRTGGSFSVAGWIFFSCGLVFYIDLHHHGDNHGEKSVSFPLVGEGDYVNKGVHCVLCKNSNQKKSKQCKSESSTHPRKWSNSPPPSSTCF